MVSLLAAALVIAAHEAGHALAAQAQGLRWQLGVARLGRVPIAPCVRAEPSRLVALAGPVAASLAAVALWRVDPLSMLVLGAIAGPISLLPFKRFDGAHLWR